MRTLSADWRSVWHTVMLYSDLSDVELLEVLTCFLFCPVIVAGVCKRRKRAQHHHCCKLRCAFTIRCHLNLLMLCHYALKCRYCLFRVLLALEKRPAFYVCLELFLVQLWRMLCLSWMPQMTGKELKLSVFLQVFCTSNILDSYILILMSVN